MKCKMHLKQLFSVIILCIMIQRRAKDGSLWYRVLVMYRVETSWSVVRFTTGSSLKVQIYVYISDVQTGHLDYNLGSLNRNTMVCIAFFTVVYLKIVN